MTTTGLATPPTTDLPPSHPPVDASVSGSSATCPVTGVSVLPTSKGGPNEWQGPKDGDIRSPCPALNTMANHGFIPRDGKSISASAVSSGLKACYGLSTPLAAFLAYVGYVVLGKMGRSINLNEIGYHNKVEHDASLVHADTPEGETYAPIEINAALVEAFEGDVVPSRKEVEAANASIENESDKKRVLLSLEDVARSRIRREAECRPITALRGRIARGEMAIILGVMSVTAGGKTGIPLDDFKTWIGQERLPEGWKPSHAEGLMDVVKRGNALAKTVAEAQKALNAKKKDA